MAKKDRSETEDSGTGVAPGQEAETSHQMSAEERARLEARRRILKGGLASAPLILTLASRPALGRGGYGTCSVSGQLSGNLSNPQIEDTTWCRGKPPSYWKVKGDYCSNHNYFESGPTNPIYQDYYESQDYSVPSTEELLRYRESLEHHSWNWFKIWKVDQYLRWLEVSPELDEIPPFGTPFAEVFDPGIVEDAKLTMMQALWLDEELPYPPSGNAGPSPLLANIAAAYCNSIAYGKTYFGLSSDELIEMVNRDVYADPVKLEEQLKMLNNQG